MTVQELIEKLKSIEDKSMKVVVQYRDEGGDYDGVDVDIRGDISEETVDYVTEETDEFYNGVRVSRVVDVKKETVLVL